MGEALLAEIISTVQSDREVLGVQEVSRPCSEGPYELPRLALNGSPCLVKADAVSCFSTNRSPPLKDLSNLFSCPVTPVASTRSSVIDQELQIVFDVDDDG